MRSREDKPPLRTREASVLHDFESKEMKRDEPEGHEEELESKS